MTPRKSDIGRAASAAARAQLADRLSALTGLDAAEIETLFPEPRDRAELLRLMTIVASSASENEKKAMLIEGIGDIAGAVLRIASRFAAPGP